MSTEGDAASLERALRESQRRLAAIVAGAPLVLWAIDRDMKFTVCEGRALEVFGLTPERMVGRDAAALFADRPDVIAAARRALAGAEVNELVDYFGRVWDVTMAPARDDGEIVGVIGVNTDVTDRRRTEEALARSELRYRTLVEESPDAVLAVDGDGKILEANDAAERLFGRPAAALRGRALLSIVTEPSDEEDPDAFPLVARRADGEETPVELRTIQHESMDGPAMTATLRDLTERHRHESRLRDLADHDPLTGLLNRRRYEEELERVIARSARYGRSAAAVLLDLDDLKAVNDSLGHTAGDAMLRVAAEALLGRVRADDVLARLGGDEFGVVLEEAGAEEAQRLAEDLLAALREQPLAIGGATTRMSASAGVTVIEPSSTAEQVLDRVDAAMYEAKELGRDRVVVLDAGQEARSPVRRAWTERIEEALAEDRFVLHAQATIDLAEGDVVLWEVLVRLRESDGRLLPPRAFLAQAERAGLAIEVDRAVVLAAGRALSRAGDGERLAINLSAASVAEPGFAGGVADTLAAMRLDPDRIVLEVAETAALADADRAAAFAAEVHEAGMSVALDDFGAGFSSFHTLKHVPLDFVKIDREYVAGVRTTRADRVLVRGLVQMARGLGVRTIAPFVEDEATREALRELGVDLAQGHAIGHAMPIEQALATV